MQLSVREMIFYKYQVTQPSHEPTKLPHLVTHGNTKVVSTSYLLGNQEEGGHQRKLRKSRVRKPAKWEWEETGSEGVVMRGAGEVRGDTGDRETGLVMRVDKKFCHSNSEVHHYNVVQCHS